MPRLALIRPGTRNSDLREYFEEYVHDKTHRAILKDRFIDGISIGELSEKYSLDERWIKRLCSSYISQFYNS